ncbi:hypothetical protein SPRG_08699 [Saprolegnia parasitica CBS 223.65]|uniref:PDZ domain-containing protein n=1 Tax=Saprolegnia parasitica (strain CBS 223.65) TaxID=695850 RepID=A0A067CHL1_SAPPC|nr:hypothetical protein SPRG_08699 [Saprolegnia parasitica CBS 223.65]KDO26046.1 hypothetical protein SPRG_08699 [Saprolegnia parasitica CBS 223.65]|eukprot:XP_012203332.1 hypothetical protein SPRG_08699 [Saprolegnia parasitica CBS 223.65]
MVAETTSVAVPLRLVAKLRTYDLSWNASLPAESLLHQARDLTEHQIALDALFNTTQGREVDLTAPLGQSVAPNDVVEAKSFLDMPDDSYTTLPWFAATTSQDGLFYQQLCAMAIVGKRENRRVAREMRQRAKDTDQLLSLMALYFQTSPDQPNVAVVTDQPRIVVRARRASSAPAAPPSPVVSSAIARSPPRSPDVSAFTDSDSEDPPMVSPPPRATPPPSIKVTTPEDVFDVVFTQKAIGLKLIMDDGKRYAIVRECMAGSEAHRYPDIQPGVAVVAVNGQSMHGIGLNRTLSRLREAPRPVVVRFGHAAKATSASWSDLM